MTTEVIEESIIMEGQTHFLCFAVSNGPARVRARFAAIAQALVARNPPARKEGER